MTQPPTLADLIALATTGAALASKSATGPLDVHRYDADDASINWQLQQAEDSGGEDDAAEVICNIMERDWSKARQTAEFFAWCAVNVSTLAAAAERWAGAVSGNREALGLLCGEIVIDTVIALCEDDAPPAAVSAAVKEGQRKAGERIHALGAASRDEEMAALRAKLAARIESHCNDLQFASAKNLERLDAIERLTAERDRARDEAFAAVHVIHGHKIEAARAEGYAAGLAAAAPPVLADVGALHGGRVAADTPSPPAMGGEESER